ncbi:Dfp1/Him1, central region-domain-containing protein [Amylostereum chailletii]|nr:Dfp1/Him1, central region-domain-containing protein [Amylostereum chailletii]
MATVARRPIVHRPTPHPHPPFSPRPNMGTRSTSVSGSLKRARSPERPVDHLLLNVKRQKSAPSHSPAPTTAPQSAAPRDEDAKAKEQKRANREFQKEEFRIKYSRAFPSFTFYFHTDVYEDTSAKERLVMRIEQMGSVRVEDFFSKDGVTHFITNQLPEEGLVTADKENAPSFLKSPIRLRGLPADDLQPPTDDRLLSKARSWGMKIWSVGKLESVLDRCNAPATPLSSRAGPIPTPGAPTLSRLLETERLHGTTERDPAQKRHDYRYFSKNTYFVLVEDLRQELAPIHAFEYPIKKGEDGREQGAWPVLYCHPDARGPFIEYDDREKRRAKRQMDQERERDYELQRRQRKLLEKQRRAEAERIQEAERTGDLRRSISMVNLRRRFSNAADAPNDILEFDQDIMDSANASGYLASQYVAASGNSVSITSTTGTTSTAGRSLRSTQLPAVLRGKQQQEVITSRRVGITDKGKSKVPGEMGPPAGIPERKLLRKSKSTNTMRLPKRDEGAKPGYCENCRQRYDDFDDHIGTRKHRRFAENEANFLYLDDCLARIRRPTVEEVAEARAREAEMLARRRRQREMNSSESPGIDTMRSSSEVSDFLPQPKVDYAVVADEDIDLDAEGEDDPDVAM